MTDDSGRTISFWQDDHSVPPLLFNKLQEAVKADVCIIGGGIAGMSVAYCLACDGHKVVVVEDGTLGGGETGRSTAHLSFALDDQYTKLTEMFGVEGATLAAASHRGAVDFIERIIAEEHIECDFMRLDGYYFNDDPDKASIDLDAELNAAQEAGLKDTYKMARPPLPDTVTTGEAICFPQQGAFHPLKYLQGLARAVQKRGGRIYTQTRALSIDEKKNFVRTAYGSVTAKKIVIATNDPIVPSLIPDKNMPYRSYALTTTVPKGTVPHALYWSTDDPYSHLFCRPLNTTQDLLLFGGCDHRTGVRVNAKDAYDYFETLEAWARFHVPQIDKILHRWSGQLMEPVDSLAFIGHLRKNLYVVTGGSGHGLTHGTIAGIILSDLIAGRDNPWAALYNPHRIIHGVRLGWLKWVTYTIHFLQQWMLALLPGWSEQTLAPGQGKLVWRLWSKRATFRDKTGKLFRFQGRCPHDGALLSWNNIEHSWDCPGHGCRYDAHDGHVLNGPSNVALKKS